ncbi:MAG: hypothetical protein NTX57_05185, partial [Armatimonadetes bacterium]|nr:hypothetical protein [Armatimonadota bacterium]
MSAIPYDGVIYMNRFLVLLLFLVFSSCKSDSDKNIKYILTPEQIRDLATPSDIVARIDFNSAS